jgi:hypothetical protein
MADNSWRSFKNILTHFLQLLKSLPACYASFTRDGALQFRTGKLLIRASALQENVIGETGESPSPYIRMNTSLRRHEQ